MLVGRKMAWLVTVAGLAFLTAACTASPQLAIPGADPPARTNGTSYGIATNMSETLGVGTFCLTSAGEVTITGVALHHPYGVIRVDGFAVRPNPSGTGVEMVGNTATKLASITGFHPDSAHVVTSLCPTPAEITTSTSEYELAIQLTRLSGTLAGAFDLDIVYTSGSETHTFTAPYGFWLCSGKQPASGSTNWTLESGDPPPC